MRALNQSSFRLQFQSGRIRMFANAPVLRIRSLQAQKSLFREQQIQAIPEKPIGVFMIVVRMKDRDA